MKTYDNPAQEIDALKTAARKLTAECRCLIAYAERVKAVIGTTNYECLVQQIREMDKLV